MQGKIHPPWSWMRWMTTGSGDMHIFLLYKGANQITRLGQKFYILCRFCHVWIGCLYSSRPTGQTMPKHIPPFSTSSNFGKRVASSLQKARVKKRHMLVSVSKPCSFYFMIRDISCCRRVLLFQTSTYKQFQFEGLFWLSEQNGLFYQVNIVWLRTFSFTWQYKYRKRSTVRLPLSGQHSGILKN